MELKNSLKFNVIALIVFLIFSGTIVYQVILGQQPKGYEYFLVGIFYIVFFILVFFKFRNIKRNNAQREKD
ncbi:MULTISPECIES: hypothetical protein [Salimicrobium]|uniref:Uncharacterized protein n=1 Tax=Salimicrobium humidisoli TaxID=2029857 RepID=A0ABX4HUH5_9BACI|nr:MULTISPECIES: hypothetical protein [Salimicrobium]PBB06882.1 hypothetical protein CKW00_00020 [Salimicrobium humidisoli]